MVFIRNGFSSNIITSEELKNFESELKKKKFKKRKTQEIKHFKKLAKAYREGNLVFILGSGVSLRNGLPNWNMLLQRLLLKIEFEEVDSEIKSELFAKIFNSVFNPEQLIAARYIKNHYENQGMHIGSSFEELIRTTLYEGLNQNQNPLFEEIQYFCEGSGKKRVDSIITYNYDDILERYFKEKGIPSCSVYSAPTGSFYANLPIYHVHGYLPQNNQHAKCDIILSEDMYHKQYNDIYNWNNLLQIIKFTEKTCLFLGFSLKDPNSRRLLDIAAKQRGNSNISHYIFRERISPIEIEKKLKSLLEQDISIYNEKGEQRIRFTELVKKMILLQEKFLEEDAHSFGIETIWINNYDEIPDKLNKIRTDNSI